MSPISIVLPEIGSGKLVALGVSTTRRSALLPGVPTIADAGVTGFDFPIWYGLWAPARTPSEIVTMLANAVARALAMPHMRQKLTAHDAEPMSMTQPEFAHFIQAESEAAARLLKLADLTL
jgi:tripartite-type tricarboxylate transporter receptor subunit TctC